MQDKVDHSPGDGVDSAVVPRAGLAKPNMRKADTTTRDCWAERREGKRERIFARAGGAGYCNERDGGYGGWVSR